MSEDRYRIWTEEDEPDPDRREFLQFMEDDREAHHERRAGEGHRRCPECGADLTPWAAS